MMSQLSLTLQLLSGRCVRACPYSSAYAGNMHTTMMLASNLALHLKSGVRSQVFLCLLCLLIVLNLLCLLTLLTLLFLL